MKRQGRAMQIVRPFFVVSGDGRRIYFCKKIRYNEKLRTQKARRESLEWNGLMEIRRKICA